VRLRRTHFEPEGSQEISGFGGASPSRGSTSPIQNELLDEAVNLGFSSGPNNAYTVTCHCVSR
jgi:hypothetical protein